MQVELVDCPWTHGGKSVMVTVPNEFLAEVRREAAAEALEEHAAKRYEAHLKDPELPMIEQPSQLARHYKSAADSLRTRAEAYRQERKEQ